MAGGIDWFRWHHGTVSDPKFQLVAKKTGTRVADVLAVWATLLEAASQSDIRGNHGEIDYESVDFSLGLEDGNTMAICKAMIDRGMLGGDGSVISWSKRQVKREREDSSTPRVRAHRERARIDDDFGDHETPRNANEGTETPREEESREDNKEHKSSCPQQAEDGRRFRFAEIRDAYNRICSPVLPACRSNTKQRQAQVRQMAEIEFNGKRPFREHGLKMWESYFQDCLTNKHWTGENDRGWRADFDFVTKPKNAIKLLERICG